MKKWTAWARRWISGEDRSQESAGVVLASPWAANAAGWAANAAANVEYAAGRAARAAATAKGIDLLEVIEKVCGNPGENDMEKWTEWARRWLSGEDRSQESADAVWLVAEAYYAMAAQAAAAWAAAWAAEVAEVDYAMAARAAAEAVQEAKGIDLLDHFEKVCG